MFTKFRAVMKNANFHWKDVALIIFISMALMLLTNHITKHLCN